MHKIILYYYKYNKKQLKIAGPKSTLTRVVGIITDKMHRFKQQSFYEKCVGVHFVCYYPGPTTLVNVLFGPTIPTYFYNFLVAFYTCNYYNNRSDKVNVLHCSFVPLNNWFHCICASQDVVENFILLQFLCKYLCV